MIKSDGTIETVGDLIKLAKKSNPQSKIICKGNAHVTFTTIRNTTTMYVDLYKGEQK